MRYYLNWIWHRLTCATCYGWAPFRVHHVDDGRSFGGTIIGYLGLMFLIVVAGSCTGHIMGWS